MKTDYVKIIKTQKDMDRIIDVDELHVEILDTRNEFEFNILHHPKGMAFDQAYAHKGEEAIYVLTGEVDYQLGEETVKLHHGDWLWHPSCITHNSTNVGKERSKMLYAVAPSTWLHPEVDENLVKPQEHPSITGMDKPYLSLPSSSILDKKEMDGVILNTCIVAPRIMGYKILFPSTQSALEIKENLFKGISLVYVLEGSIIFEAGKTKDQLLMNQSVVFTSELGCLLTSKEKTCLLMCNVGGRYYTPANPKIRKD
ncbi:cupin domain-containing protein [bacterium]|nr:cupin domain-containing protein [bacterium]